MAYISMTKTRIPVCTKVDLCVVGGGVTGTFAAVRAARLGLKVAIVERFASLGGMATNGRVNIWHSLYNTTGDKQIIAGLTEEVIHLLQAEGVTDHNHRVDDRVLFNSEPLKWILDDLVQQCGIELFLHSFYAGVETEADRVTHVLMCGKDGLCAIEASFVIDATGDGDIARDLGLPGYRLEPSQPPTPVFLLHGDARRLDLTKLYHAEGEGLQLGEDFCAGWHEEHPSAAGLTTRADLHVSQLQLDHAQELTRAEVEGRRRVRDMLHLLQKAGKASERYHVIAMANCIGIRDTMHYETRFKANELDLLLGKSYEDTILQGTYIIDIHCAYGSGIIFKLFDGTIHHLYPQENRSEYGNWRKEYGIAQDYPVPTYYQLPFSNLVNEQYRNFIAAGRMIHADIGSFGALRVMVNLNQLGEAAGVAAYLCVQEQKALQALDGVQVRNLLRKGGSAL